MKPMRDYAAPLIALDRVLEMDCNGLRTAKAVAGNEPFFAGHYPDYPIYPGVFIIEAVNQAVRHFSAENTALARPVRLTQVQSVRFLAPLRPGDRLEVTCRCTVGADSRSLQVQAECTSGPDKVVAQVKLKYILGEEHGSP